MGSEDQEEAHKKLNLGSIVSGESASIQIGSEDRQEAHKKLKLGSIFSASNQMGGEDRQEARKKLKLGPIVSGESASNRPFFNPKVVFFSHSLPNEYASLQLLKPKLVQFGNILYGPTPLAFLNDVAFLIYESPPFLVYESKDGANKAVENTLRIPVEDQNLILDNTIDFALDAVRRFVLGQFTPQLEKLKAHPVNSIVYVSNVYSETTRDELKDFFSQFGEIVEGPSVFELEPEAAWLFCLLAYKSGEGARHALKQPIKDFKDHQMYCSADIETPVRLYEESMLEDLKLSVKVVEGLQLNRQQAAAEEKALAEKKTPLAENPKMTSVLNDVVVAAEKLNKAADLALAAAENPKMTSVLNDVVVAAGMLNKAADLALAAAERFSRASSFMEMAPERVG